MDFVEVSHQVWRGRQPNVDELAELQDACGLTAVINLRAESELSEQMCQRLGLTYHFYPVVDWSAPHLRQVMSVLKLIDDHPDECFLIHCQAGIGRTGVMVSCYRVSQGWMSAPEALELSDDEARRARMVDVQRQFVLEFAEQL